MNNPLKQLLALPHNIRQKVRLKLRDKAIERARTRAILAGVDFNDLSEDDAQVLIKEEEDKLISGMKDKSLAAILALLGLSLFG